MFKEPPLLQQSSTGKRKVKIEVDHVSAGYIDPSIPEPDYTQLRVTAFDASMSDDEMETIDQLEASQMPASTIKSRWHFDTEVEWKSYQKQMGIESTEAVDDFKKRKKTGKKAGSDLAKIQKVGSCSSQLAHSIHQIMKEKYGDGK